MLEELESDEPFMMINRLMTHKVFLTNYIKETQSSVEPSCNFFGFHKHLKHESYTCYEYTYSNLISINNYLSSTSFDFETYDKINKASEEQYFEESD